MSLLRDVACVYILVIVPIHNLWAPNSYLVSYLFMPFLLALSCALLENEKWKTKRKTGNGKTRKGEQETENDERETRNEERETENDEQENEK